MKKFIYFIFPIIALLLLNSCSQKKPAHHPKSPNYGIKKPKVIYKPSKKNLGKMVKKLQGSPYVWAEEGPNNFDCSGFTYYMYGSMGIELPRVAREQAKNGKEIKMHELVYGDLIFFDTDRRPTGKITHVGMYLGNGWFTHASTGKHEVVYSNLNTSAYYTQRLRICRRYLPDRKGQVATAGIKPWKRTKPGKVYTPAASPIATVESAPVSTHASVQTQKETLGNYYVQVGSFTDKPKNALTYQITKAGYRYKLIQFTINGKEISKLLIGPYRQKEEALGILPDVRQQIQKDAFIAEIR